MPVEWVLVNLGLGGLSMGQLFLKCFFEIDEVARKRMIKCPVEINRLHLAHGSFPNKKNDRDALARAGAI